MTDAEVNEYKRERRVRILVVDSHSVIREALSELIGQQPDLVVCAEACNQVEALGISEQERVDLAIVGTSLKGGIGVGLVAKLTTRRPKLPVVVISTNDMLANCMSAFKAGAMGYVVKHEIAKFIVAAVRKVLEGEAFVSGTIEAKVSHAGFGGLSDFLSHSSESR